MDAFQERLRVGVRQHVLRRARGMADLIIRQQAALHDVVLLAPVKEGFGAGGVMVQGQRGFAGLGPADEVTVHVPLAEAVEGNIFLSGPADKAAKLDFIIPLGFCARVARRWG